MPIASALMGLFFLSGAGIAGMPARASAPSMPQPDYLVAMTGYNAVPGQTDDEPDITASGAFSNPEIIVARSQDLADELPFGTIIAIDGPVGAQTTCGYGIVKPVVGYRIVGDAMNVKFTNRIDILFDTKSNYVMADGAMKNAGIVLGKCDHVAIRVVGKVDMSHPGKLPKTQSELAAIVLGGANSLAVK